MIPVMGGDPALDANNWAIVWAGNVSQDNNYFDARIVGAEDGLRLRVQVMDRYVEKGDTISVTTGFHTYTTSQPDANFWTVGTRCNDMGTECRGWSGDFYAPWAIYGEKPAVGSTTPLTITVLDIDQGAERTKAQWAGTVIWGGTYPTGTNAPVGQEGKVQTVTVPLTDDGEVGGGTNCGADDYPTYFLSWGLRVWYPYSDFNIQSQWDIADWPCYSKYYAKWDLPTLPEGAKVLSATLTARQFGNAGYEQGQTGTTVVQVFEVVQSWHETQLAWDNAPLPVRTISRLAVPPLPATCEQPYYYCNPGVPYSFDVTGAVQQARGDGRSWASVALYTAAGQYHSGKYFWQRITNQAPTVTIAYLIP